MKRAICGFALVFAVGFGGAMNAYAMDHRGSGHARLSGAASAQTQDDENADENCRHLQTKSRAPASDDKRAAQRKNSRDTQFDRVERSRR